MNFTGKIIKTTGTGIVILLFMCLSGKIEAQCVNAGSDDEMCQGAVSQALGGSFNGEATSAIWSDTIGGVFTSNGGLTPDQVTWTPPALFSGTTVLILTAYGGACEGETDTVKMTVNALPVPVITGPAFAGKMVSGNVYSTQSGQSDYIWNIPSEGNITSGGDGFNSVTVTWTISGNSTLSVTYTNSEGCTANPEYYNVTVDAPPVAGNVKILGDAVPGKTLYAYYTYSDEEGDDEGTSQYRWYRGTSSGGSNPQLIPSETGLSYKVTDSDAPYFIGFSVRPLAVSGYTTGNTVTTAEWPEVLPNEAPEVSSVFITDSNNVDVDDVLTGHYTYSDNEGDIEEGSTYEWLWSNNPTGTYQAVAGATGISHAITMGEQGRYFKFVVRPQALTGEQTGLRDTSRFVGPVNSKPVATNVTISGTPNVNSTLTGSYTYSDVDLDAQKLGAGGSSYLWFRSGVAITGATALTYTIRDDDVDQTITFRVIPVAQTGYPDTGDAVLSSPVGPVDDPASTPPVATDPCISGIRKTGEVLTGHYIYSNKYTEKNSVYFWYRGTDELKSGTGDLFRQYTLVPEDKDKEIFFAVVPRNKRDQSGTKIYSKTLAMFTIPRDIFSEADTAQELIANPSGGVFYGMGVSNGYFFPQVVGPDNSPYELKYIYNDAPATTSCIQNVSKMVEVKPVATVMEGINPIYCDSSRLDTIYIRNVPAGATEISFSITDIAANLTQLNDTTAVFDPDRLKSGRNDTIFFSFKDGVTPIKLIGPLVIDHIGVVSVQNLDPGTAICSNIKPFELYTSHPGGIFTGPVNAGKLDPSMVSVMGPDTVIYKYTSSSGCSQTVTVPVIINPAPVVDFLPADSCILNNTDSTRFINKTVSEDNISSWLWQFTEAGSTSISDKFSPSFLYKSGNIHIITLTATTINKCSSTIEKTIDIGFKPVADFSWKNDCWHPGDSIYFLDKTVSASKIKAYSWNFFDGDSLHTVPDPSYPKKSTGYLDVRYIVTTNYPGCHDTIFRSVYIRPLFKVTGDSYFESFENGNNGWVKDYEDVNSWTFGTPDRPVIKGAASGSNAWYTGYNMSAQVKELSSVVSPCFDFTEIKRPMIRIKSWKRFDRNHDGATLQYRIGDSDEWQYVGMIDDGINWFNSALIRSPGGNLMGWTTVSAPETKWMESLHNLNDLQGKSDVKFRIAYGSDGSSQENDGMAFDDIWIGERSRNVLLEHFVNNSSLKSSEATRMVNTIVQGNPDDIINIQYHTNFPGADPYFDDNPGDGNARVLYYGLIKVPYSFIDGGSRKDYANLYDYYLADINSSDVNRRSMINPLFNINIISDISGGVLNVGGRISALMDISNAENMSLYIAVTEKVNNDHTGAAGETVFYNVFRKFLPDAGGISLKKVWTKGESFDIPEKAWIIEKIANTADIEVIVFVQNNITKEVYQAASVLKQDITVGIEDIPGADGKDFSLYPNPAVNRLTITFKDPPEQDAEIRIYDSRGVPVSVYKIESGAYHLEIQNTGLKSGIYLVRVFVGNRAYGYKKLVITGQ